MSLSLPPFERTSSEGSSSGHSAGGRSEDTLNDTEEQERQTPPSSKAWRDDIRIWIPAHNHTQSPNNHKRSLYHRSRTLVLCFDGTGDQCDTDNSNIVNFVAMLKKQDNKDQLVYYQAGIGTYANSVVKTLGLTSIYEILDEMLALDLGSHIKAGYTFLMQNYTQGDKICIFGFSRGAYTARALAGMLQKVGLLSLCNNQQVPFAYDMYKRTDTEGLQICETFKRTFCRTVHVEFLGVWDTVASVGAIPQYLPFVSDDNGIHHLRHALSLDERRVKFLPTYCVDPRKETWAERLRHGHHNNVTPQKEVEDQMNAKGARTDLLQVWFAGVHTDVGGGSVSNGTQYALARIPLRWMIRECFRCNTGIIFDAVMLQQVGIGVNLDTLTLRDIPPRLSGNGKPQDSKPVDEPNVFLGLLRSLWTAVTTPLVHVASLLSPNLQSTVRNRPLAVPARGHNQQYTTRNDVNEAEEEWHDARAPLHDQLKTWWIWRVMEYIPWRIKRNRAIINETDDVESYEWIWNRGRGREIHRPEMQEGMKVHRSVKTRLEAGALSGGVYVPQARPRIPWDAQHKHQAKRLDHNQWNVDDPVHWQWVDSWNPYPQEA